MESGKRGGLFLKKEVRGGAADIGYLYKRRLPRGWCLREPLLGWSFLTGRVFGFLYCSSSKVRLRLQSPSLPEKIFSNRLTLYFSGLFWPS